MPKFVNIIMISFVIFISSAIGAMMGSIIGAVLLPTKIFNIISDDSTGKSSDKI